MATRDRPPGLCCPVRPPAALPARERRRLVAVLKALADPTRLEIFRLVAAQPGPICACDITPRVSAGQPTISHHLKILREAGLVTASRRGVFTFYEATRDGLAPLADVAPPAAATQPAP